MAGVKSSNICKICKNTFGMGGGNEKQGEYCINCITYGWQKEMHEKGCSVIRPENLGKQSHVIDVKFSDCPVVIINGECYRDTTNLLYEDTKYKKTYPTHDEWAKIKAYQLKKEKVKKAKRDRLIASQEEAERLKDERVVEERRGKRKARKRRVTKTEEQRAEEERIKRAGIEERRAAKKAREKEVNEGVLALLSDGVYRKDIEDYSDFSRYEVDKAINQLHKSGLLKKEKRKRYTAEEDNIMREMHKNGAKDSEIAKVLGRAAKSITTRRSELRKRDKA